MIQCRLTFLLLILTVIATGQNQTNVWHFGSGAGIDFNSGTATPVAGGQTTGQEAVSSIADVNGNLLFYTDGATAWTRNHTVMPNGVGLNGGPSATQTLIVPIPGNCSSYYIFHVQDHQSSAAQLRYSKVDMCLNNGFGDVVATAKNILLNSPCGEKITAVKHQNDTDIWVISHKLSSNQFIAYLVTAGGIQGPVTTSIGGTHASNHMIGPIKSSHNGNKICVANTFGNLCELYDFNKATGVISNQVNLVNAYSLPGGIYGIEFSPNDSLLYISTTWTVNRLYQLDLFNSTAILVNTGPTSSYTYGALQMGPDNRIYLAMNTQNSLSVITSPNTSGMGCNFVSNALTLAAGTTCLMGLPNSIPSAYKETIISDFSFLGNDTTLSTCASITLAPPSTCNAVYNWSDGSTSASINVIGSGSYWVTVNNICGTLTDTINVTMPVPLTVQSTASQLCAGDSVTLSVSGGSNYSWNNGSNSDSIIVSPLTTTTYSVSGSNSCGTDTVAFTVYVSSFPDVSISGVDSMCAGQPVIFAASGADTYVWNDGTVSDTLFLSPTESDTILVAGSNYCGTDSDTLYITVTEAPALSLSGNNVICAGDSAVLSVTGAENIIWSTGAATDTIVVYPAADSSYTVSAGNYCGTDVDTITVSVVTVAVVSVSGNGNICSGDSTTLTATGTSSYSWSTGATGNSITVSPASSSSYTVTGTSTCGSDTSVFSVVVSPLPVLSINGTDTICAGDSVALNAAGAAAYAWNSGDTVSSIIVAPLTSSVYTVNGTTNSCSSAANFSVTVNPVPQITVSGSDSICAGDTATLTATGASAYSWNTGSASNNITVSPASTSTFVVSGSANGCSDTVSFVVSVNPVPVVSISGTDTICTGQSITLSATGANVFTWNNGAAGSAITISPTTSQTYSVTGTSLSCSDSAFFTVTVNPVPVVTITGSDSVCQGQSVTLTAGGATTYLWSNGSTAGSITVSPASSASYSVTGVSSSCSDTGTHFIHVIAPPVVAVTGDDSICEGENTVLYASGASTYIWNNGSTQSIQVVSPSASTMFTVTGSGACGTDTSAIFVTVSPLPQSSFTASIACNRLNVNAQPVTGADYYFNFGDNMQQQIGISATHYYTDTGMFSITLIVSVNGCTDSVNQQINIMNLPVEYLVIPNIFTPNGDGKNDVYLVPGSCEKLSGVIYNRWGQKMFESDDIGNNGWNGSYDGKQVPDDVYFILLTDEKGKNYTGDIQIPR